MKRNLLTAAELLLVVLVAVAACYTVYRQQAVVRRYDVSGCVSGSEDLIVTLDDISQDSEHLQIWGWAILSEKDTGYFDSWVLLRFEDTGEYFRIPTAAQTRTDVTEVLGDGVYTYDNAGFYAQAETKRLEPGNYEICLVYNEHSDNMLQATGVIVTID